MSYEQRSKPTIIEWLTIVIICFILFLVSKTVYDCRVNGIGCPKKDYVEKVNDLPPTCIHGYVFVNYSKNQLIDDQGRGIKCDMEKPKK